MKLTRQLVFRLSKGFRGRAKNCWRIALPRVEKALLHGYIGRKLKKRIARETWITRLNASLRQYNISYSRFMHAYTFSGLAINRKMLSELAIYEPYSFKAIVEYVKKFRPVATQASAALAYPILPPTFKQYRAAKFKDAEKHIKLPALQPKTFIYQKKPEIVIPQRSLEDID